MLLILTYNILTCLLWMKSGWNYFRALYRGAASSHSILSTHPFSTKPCSYAPHATCARSQCKIAGDDVFTWVWQLYPADAECLFASSTDCESKTSSPLKYLMWIIEQMFNSHIEWKCTRESSAPSAHCQEPSIIEPTWKTVSIKNVGFWPNCFIWYP